MTARARRRGLFEGPPHLLYRRTGARYLDGCAAVIVLNGAVVALFGLMMVALYLELSAGELAVLLATWVAALVLEGLVAALAARRVAQPAREWLRGARDERSAWAAAARLPLALLRRPVLSVLGVLGAAATSVVSAALLDLSAADGALLLPLTLLLYVSCVILRFLGLELAMRPLLGAIGERLDGAVPLEAARVSLHRRLMFAVPMVTWGASVIVAGLLTADTRELDTLGRASVIAFAVTAAVSLWLSGVLADAVSGPVIDLRDATRRVGGGDLGVRVPVVSTDETGELAESFNAMVAGLGERERLRDAFGTYVDPSLTERILAEGMDLHGEELEVSVLVLDVRGFTAFAERAPAHEVVAALNELYEAVVPVILRRGGHANKFVGDGLLAVFGAPVRHADHAPRAVCAAREIAALVRRQGRLSIGVGVNTGRAVVGTIGGGGRRDFTVIGDAVNTAARVEAATRTTGDDVLITEATLRALGPREDDFEERPLEPLKGKTAPVRLFAPR